MVKSVFSGDDGKPMTVDVALNGTSKVVALSVDNLGFDSSRNMLIATMTNDQIKALPDANG